MLSGVLLHHRHVMMVVLVVLLQFHHIRVCGAESIDEVVAMFGRQPGVVPLRAALVCGETKSLFSQTCDFLTLFARRSANRVFVSN